MATVLEKIREAGLVRTRGALGDYWRLVREAATEKADIDPDTVLDACEKAGKSVDEFQEDLETLARRIATSARLPEAVRMEQRVAELARELAKHEDEFKRVCVEFHQRGAKLKEEQIHLEGVAAGIRGEHRRAFEKCPYPELGKAHAEVCAGRAVLAQEAEALAVRIFNAKGRIADDAQRRAGGRGGWEEAKHLAPNLPAWESRLRDLNDEIARADAELRRIELERLKP